jgi:hypothetical protein
VTQAVAVFDVVVDQRVVVQELNGRACRKRDVVGGSEGAGRRKNEPGPKPLARARALPVGEAEMMAKLRSKGFAVLGVFDDTAKVLLESIERRAGFRNDAQTSTVRASGNQSRKRATTSSARNPGVDAPVAMPMRSSPWNHSRCKSPAFSTKYARAPSASAISAR